jgi:hypothetical protein
MGILKRSRRNAAGEIHVNGREYFRRAERELRIENLDPAAIRKDLEPLALRDGSARSRVGGSIAHNLKCLSPEGAAERRRRSERFLKQPDKHFPAEEEQPQPPRLRK